MNTISSSPMFKKLKIKMDESSREKWKETKFGVIAGPFKTMADVWDRLAAFEKKWEQEAEFDDIHSNSIKAVEERVAKSLSVLKVEHGALKRQLAAARGTNKDKGSLNAICNELQKRGNETLQQDSTLPCLLCMWSHRLYAL